MKLCHVTPLQAGAYAPVCKPFKKYDSLNAGSLFKFSASMDSVRLFL